MSGVGVFLKSASLVWKRALGIFLADCVILLSVLFLVARVPALIDAVAERNLSSDAFATAGAAGTLVFAMAILRATLKSFIIADGERATLSHISQSSFSSLGLLRKRARRVANHLGRCIGSSSEFWAAAGAFLIGLGYLVFFYDSLWIHIGVVGVFVIGTIFTIPAMLASQRSATGMRETRSFDYPVGPLAEDRTRSVDSFYASYKTRMITANFSVFIYYISTSLCLLCVSCGLWMAEIGRTDILPIVALCVFLARLHAKAMGEMVKGSALSEAYLEMQRELSSSAATPIDLWRICNGRS